MAPNEEKYSVSQLSVMKLQAEVRPRTAQV
jgi:hypothetical protein